MAVQGNGNDTGQPDVGDKAAQLRQRIEARRAQMNKPLAGGAPGGAGGGGAPGGGVGATASAASQASPPQAQAGQPTGGAPQPGTGQQGVQGANQQGMPPQSLRKPPANGNPIQQAGAQQAPQAQQTPQAGMQQGGAQPVSIGQQNGLDPGAPQPGELAGPNGQPNAADLNARKKGLFAKGKQVKAQLDSIDPTTAQYLAVFFNNLLYSLFMSPLKTVSSVFTTYIVFEAKDRILNLLVGFGLVLAIPMMVLAIWEYNWVLLAYPIGVVLAFDLLYVQSFWGGDSSIEKIDQIIAETTKGEQELKGFAQSGETGFSGQAAESTMQGSSDLQGVRYATADQLQELTTPSTESSVEEFDDDYLL